MSYGIKGMMSLENVQSSLMPTLKSTEQDLAGILQDMGPAATTADLLKAQSKMTQWTLQAQLQSSVVKEIGDALKGIIQKAA